MTYLDHAATAPLRDEVLDAMLPWLRGPANPSSLHRAGQRARSALEQSRHDVAALLGRAPTGIVFTASASEANATWWAAQPRLGRRSVAVGPVEHPNARLAAEASGVACVVLPIDPTGRIDPAAAAGADAVSLMVANHETGIVHPIDDVLALGIPVHLDATQAVGRMALDLAGAEAVVFGGHKLGGPPGIGVLSLRDGGDFPALVPGSQERGRRGGTPYVAGAVGLAVACRLARQELDTHRAHLGTLTERLEAGLRARGARIVGEAVPRLPGTTCCVVPGVPGEMLVQALDLQGHAVASGAACASGSTEPSPVLNAMGDPEPSGALRFSLGRTTDVEAIEGLLTTLDTVLPALRALEGL